MDRPQYSQRVIEGCSCCYYLPRELAQISSGAYLRFGLREAMHWSEAPVEAILLFIQPL